VVNYTPLRLQYRPRLPTSLHALPPQTQAFLPQATTSNRVVRLPAGQVAVPAVAGSAARHDLPPRSYAGKGTGETTLYGRYVPARSNPNLVVGGPRALYTTNYFHPRLRVCMPTRPASGFGRARERSVWVPVQRSEPGPVLCLIRLASGPTRSTDNGEQYRRYPRVGPDSACKRGRPPTRPTASSFQVVIPHPRLVVAGLADRRCGCLGAG